VDIGLRAGHGFYLFKTVWVDLHYLFWILVGFTSYASIFFGFRFNGIWNLQEDRRLSLVSVILPHFISKAFGQRGSIDKGYGPEA
jgi:hypothetical protein